MRSTAARSAIALLSILNLECIYALMYMYTLQFASICNLTATLVIYLYVYEQLTSTPKQESLIMIQDTLCAIPFTCFMYTVDALGIIGLSGKQFFC